MQNWFFRLLTTCFYIFFGYWIAFPISYFFQSSIYQEITLPEYIHMGFSALQIGAEFGAIDVYRYTAFFTMIGSVAIGKLIEEFCIRRYSKAHISYKN